MIGTILKERYRIIKILGSGGMASVYLADDLLREGISVAIKEMQSRDDTMEKARFIGQFAKEAHFLTRLVHPNLPKLYDFFFHNDTPYLVLEYIEGKTLQEIIDGSQNPLNQEQVVQWAIQLCRVLDYLHSQNPRPVIFRDLKLSNIMLSNDGEIKLIDFGIAREFNPGKNTDTIRMGSIGYAPPEQYGRGGQTDMRTDIYALGVCLHTLLSKNDPSLTPFSFPYLRSINTSVSWNMNELIMKMLEIKSEKRFQDIKEVLELLMDELPGPRVKITPSVIVSGDIEKGERKKLTVIVSNNKEGILSGKLKSHLSKGVDVTPSLLNSNYQEVVIEIDTEQYNEGIYSENIIFDTNGGEGQIEISFNVIPPSPHLEVNMSFLDLGYGDSSDFKEFIIYNDGAGELSGTISTSSEWLSVSHHFFTSNELTVRVMVEKSKIPQVDTLQGDILIDTNGGTKTVEVILFKPVLDVTPSVLDFGSLSGKTYKTLNFVNTGRGVLSGHLVCKEPWVDFSAKDFKGNDVSIDVSIDPSSLIQGLSYKTFIDADTNGGRQAIPLSFKLFSPSQFIFRWFSICMLCIIILAGYYIYHNRQMTSREIFFSELSQKGFSMAFVTGDASGKVYVIKSDWKLMFLSHGHLPRWSPDGKQILVTDEYGKIKKVDISDGHVKSLVSGENPVWSPDGKKIAFEQENKVISIMEMSDFKINPVIYGHCPSWNPGGNKIVYDDGMSSGSSIKIIALNDTEPVYVANGFNPRWSPDGKYISYNIDMDNIGVVNSETFSKKTSFEGQNPSWTSDGKEIVFESKGKIYIINMTNCEKKILIAGEEPSISPDKKYLAFRNNNGINILEISSGLYYPILRYGYFPRWSPQAR